MAKAKKQGHLQKFIYRNAAIGGIDIPFFLILMTIVTIGLVMLFSASYTYSYYNRHGDSYAIFKSQAIYAVLAVIVMMLCSRVRYEYYKIVAWLATPVTYFLLLLVLILPAYDEKKPDIKRILNLKIITIQPSEIAKFVLILMLAFLLERFYKNISGNVPSQTHFAKWLSKKTNGGITIWKSFGATVALFLFMMSFAGLVYLENHVSGAILIAGIGVMMMWFGEVKFRWFVPIFIVAVLVIMIVVTNPDILAKYAGSRITAWLDKDSLLPGTDRLQTDNGLYAIGSGGLLGVGLGQSKQKHLFVPEPQNDFIFPIVCEELGFIGAVVIILLYIALVFRGVQIALRAKDRFAKLMVLGIIFQIGLQASFNIAVVTDLFPNTGIALPFFSSGGTSLVVLMAQMGAVLSVSRTIRKRE